MSKFRQQLLSLFVMFTWFNLPGRGAAGSIEQEKEDVIQGDYENESLKSASNPFDASQYVAAKDYFKSLVLDSYSSDEKKSVAFELHKFILDDKFCCGFSLENFSSQEFISAINTPLGTLKLTSLHLASGLGDIVALRWLLSQGGDPLMKAHKNWTPIHLAALHQSREVQDIFESNSVGTELVKNDIDDQKPTRIWDLTHIKSSSESRINIWDDETQKVGTIDGNKFRQIFGADFIDTFKIGPLDLVQLWVLDVEEDPRTIFDDSIIGKSVDDNARDKVYLKKVASFKIKNADLDLVGYGTFADRDFQAGDGISDYQGILWNKRGSPLPYPTDYSTTNIDASRYRGYISYCNDGAPNAVLLSKRANFIGLPTGSVLVAIRAIHRHEAILWNYGNHEVKFGNYVELNPASLDYFVSEFSFSELVQETLQNEKNLQNGKYDRDKAIEYLRAASMLAYIVDSPTVLIRLICSDLMTRQDVESLRSIIIQKGTLSWRRNSSRFMVFLEKLSTNSREIVKGFLKNKTKLCNTQVLSQFISILPSLIYDEKNINDQTLEMRWKFVSNWYCQQYYCDMEKSHNPVYCPPCALN